MHGHGKSASDMAKLDQNHASARELVLRLRDRMREHFTTCPVTLCVDSETQRDILSLSHRGAQGLLHTAILLLAQVDDPSLPDVDYVLTTDPHPSEES